MLCKFFAKCKWLATSLIIFVGVLLLWVVFKRYVCDMSGVLIGKKVEFEVPKDKIKKVILDNGLTVIAFQSKHVPKVLVQIAYDVGSTVEANGERGLAHLIEHMIFKGTQKLSESDITAISRKYGADSNAGTSYDMTSYYFEANKNNWKIFLEILADCMQNARFDEQHLASEFNTVMQEIRMYRDKYWKRMIEKALSLAFPANHPYNHPVLGFKEDLVDLKAKELKEFYEKYYYPEKATLFVVGDIDLDEAVTQATKHFNHIPKAEKLKQDVKVPGSYDLESNHTILFENVKQDKLFCYWSIPGQDKVKNELVSVVKNSLGNREGSYLHKKLVDEEKIASSVGVIVWQFKKAGLFNIIVEPREGCTEKCKESIAIALNDVIKKGIPCDVLNTVIRNEEHGFLNLMQSLSGLTRQWITSFHVTRDEYALFERIENLQKIGLGEIQNFMKAYLDPFTMSTVVLTAVPEDKKALWEENKKESDIIDNKILSSHVRTAPLEEPKMLKEMAAPNALDFTFPKPDRVVTLKNGLKVLMHKNEHVPLVYFGCKFKDADFLSKSKDGIPLELMMGNLIEGSKGYSKKQNVDFFESHGASYSYSDDGAALSVTAISHKDVLSRFFHVLLKPSFKNEALKKLKDISVDSLKRGKDDLQSVAMRLVKNTVYKNHPFEWTFDDAIEITKGIEKNDLQELHKKYLFPENMILTVVGSFDFDEMQELLEEELDAWQGAEYVAPVVSKAKFTEKEEVDHVMLRDQVFLTLAQPSTMTLTHRDFVPLKLLSFIAFNSSGSRLYELRERTGLFYDAAGAWAANVAKEPGFDIVFAILSKEKIDEAEKLIRDMINDFGENGIKEEELEDARQWYLKKLIDSTGSNSARARTLSREEEMELGFDYYDELLKKANSVALKEVNEVAKRYFTDEKLARVRVGRV